MVTPNALKTHAGMCFHAAAVRQVLEKMPTGVGMIYIFKAAEKKKGFQIGFRRATSNNCAHAAAVYARFKTWPNGLEVNHFSGI